MITGLTEWGTFVQDAYEKTVLDKVIANVEIWNLFNEVDKEATGDRIKIHMVTGESGGVAYSKAGVIPDGVDEDHLTVEFFIQDRLYGVLKMDNLLMELGNLSEHNLAGMIDATDAKMKRLQRRIENTADYVSLFGGAVKGLINEHKASTVTVDAQQQAGLGADVGETVFEYSGDWHWIDGTSHTGLGAVVNASPTTWVRCRIVRLDPTGWGDDLGFSGGTNNNLWISDYSKVNGTVTIAHGSSAGGINFTTAGIDAGRPCAILAHATQAVDGAAAALGTKYNFADEPLGIMDHLFNPLLGDKNRSVASGVANADTIRGNAFTQGSGNAASHARTTMTSTRWQEVKDIVREIGGEEGDITICNHRFRARYIAAVTVTLNAGLNTTGEVVDVGFSEPTLDKQKFIESRNAPRGMILRLKKDCFKKKTIAKGKFEDKTGSIWERVSSNLDAFRAVWRTFYGTICDDPRSNLAFCGVTY